MLAKQIVEELLQIIQEKKLEHVKSAEIEIGTVVLAHDDFPEHAEEINLENLEFGLQGIAKTTILKDVKFRLKKIEGGDWKIANIEV